MSEESLSQRIWGGEYGGFFGFGPGGVMSDAQLTYAASDDAHKKAAAIGYASVLYSIMNDFELWRFWYWPLRFDAFRCLSPILEDMVAGGYNNRAIWSAEQCETIGGILLAASRFPFVRRVRRERYRNRAEIIVEQGIRHIKGDTGFHTRVLLWTHRAKLLFESERCGYTSAKSSLGALEKMREQGLHHVSVAANEVSKVTDANQRSRCLRSIAEAYFYAYGRGSSTARRFMDEVDLVPGTGESVRRKNKKARRRMRV